MGRKAPNSPSELFRLSYAPDAQMNAMVDAMVAAAGGAVDGVAPPEMVAVLCDMIATITVQRIDVDDMRGRRELAEACRLRILHSMQDISDNFPNLRPAKTPGLFGPEVKVS